MKKYLFILMAAACAVAFSGCDDENESTLPAFDMPSSLHLVKQCVLNGELVAVSDCEAQNVELRQALFAANAGDGTLAYVPFDGDEDFDVVDITRSVPGVTSIPVGERPQAMASDDKGVLIVTTSSINNDLSVVSAYELREVAYMTLDKPARRVTYQAKDGAYYVYFLDGTVRKLTLTYDCGAGENVFKTTCKLTKDQLKFVWEDVITLDGQVFSYVADPNGNLGYVSFADRRYISVIAYNADGDADNVCSGKYPCEVDKIGTGYSCSDGIDNNGDGLVDSADPSCFYPWSVEGYSDGVENSLFGAGFVGKTECSDQIDNDGDGMVDLLDYGCVSWDDASEEDGYQPITYGSCKEGRDNEMCLWPTDEPMSNADQVRTTGMCNDGIDNDGDTLVDTADSGCYGAFGFTETDYYAAGRGEIGIDPLGRWLYVVNPVDSEILVVDLAKRSTVDLSGHFPRTRSVGIPVNRVPMDVVGDIISYNAYNKNNHKVVVEDAVAYYTTSSGLLGELTIQKDYRYFFRDVEDESQRIVIDTMWPEDDDADESYLGVIRCVSRLCGENDVPRIELRQRDSVKLDTTNKELYIDMAVYDQIMGSETWRVTYEGPLEKTRRNDGYFSKDGVFRMMSGDLCALGVREGDHLVLTSRSDTRSDLEACAPVLGEKGARYDLEWTIKEVHSEYLVVEPTGEEGKSKAAPLKRCFPTAFPYEIQASGSWIITSNSTYVNRRLAVGDKCVDNPINDYGQMRFNLDPAVHEKNKAIAAANAKLGPKDLPAKLIPDASTAFFELYMPEDAFNLVKGDAYEFTTKSEFTQKGVSLGSAPSSAVVFKSDDVHYIAVSEASANTLVIYDVDDDTIYDTI